MVGEVRKNDFYMDTFKKWFVPAYHEYVPEPAAVDFLRQHLKDKTLEVYMGTWCPDSREHVPHLLKILDEAGFPEKQLKIVALPRHYKDSPLVKGKNIIRVPTIIVYEHEKELGRIIEYPMENLEKDLVKILKGNYIHDYQQ